MKTVCNGCDFLIMDEKQQDFLKNQGCGTYPHYCAKHKTPVRHTPYSEPYIYPCKECLNNTETEEREGER